MHFQPLVARLSSANALVVAVLVLGISLILLGIVVQSWLCQASGSAFVVLAVSWAIKVLLPPSSTPTGTPTSRGIGASGQSDRP